MIKKVSLYKLLFEIRDVEKSPEIASQEPREFDKSKPDVRKMTTAHLIATLASETKDRDRLGQVISALGNRIDIEPISILVQLALLKPKNPLYDKIIDRIYNNAAGGSYTLFTVNAKDKLIWIAGRRSFDSPDIEELLKFIPEIQKRDPELANNLHIALSGDGARHKKSTVSDTETR